MIRPIKRIERDLTPAELDLLREARSAAESERHEIQEIAQDHFANGKLSLQQLASTLKKLRELRIELQRTPEQIASSLDISVDQLLRWENGDMTDAPDWNTLARYAEIFERQLRVELV